MYAKDLSEPKYEYLIKNHKNTGIKHLNNPNAFIECFNTMMTFMRIFMIAIKTKKRKILIVFDRMIDHIMDNNKFKAIISRLFIRCRKLNISLIFITQYSFRVPKDVRLNSTHYLIMKINNRRELQNISINDSADINYHNFI